MRVNILFFIESLEHGGAEKSLISLLKHLDYSKYAVTILTLKKEGALKKFLPSEVNFVHLALNYGLIGKLKFHIFKNLLKQRHNAQYFWKAFKSSIPQYSQSYDIAIGWGQGFATYYVSEKINAKKKIAWINTNYDEAGYSFEFDKSIYENYDIINGVSPFVVNVMSKYININKLSQITNIIDKDEINFKARLSSCTTFSNNSFNIVSVGRLAKPKAFDMAIEAAHLLNEKEIKFHWYIVGEGSERRFLENRIKSFLLEDKVTLLGKKDNPYPYINQCDLYVQTSKFEGLGRTLIEATILKKPIVSTDFDTAFELVENNKTGIITEKNPQSIANAIYTLYSNRKIYNYMVHNLKEKSGTSAIEIIMSFDYLINQLIFKSES